MSDPLKKSIEHWEKMATQAVTFPWHERPTPNKMFTRINEWWAGVYCPLCNTFYEESYYEGNSCISCPLEKSGYGCATDNSLWHKVNQSETWGEWLFHARKLIAVIKKIRGGFMSEERATYGSGFIRDIINIRDDKVKDILKMFVNLKSEIDDAENQFKLGHYGDSFDCLDEAINQLNHLADRVAESIPREETA